MGIIQPTVHKVLCASKFYSQNKKGVSLTYILYYSYNLYLIMHILEMLSQHGFEKITHLGRRYGKR